MDWTRAAKGWQFPDCELHWRGHRKCSPGDPVKSRARLGVDLFVSIPSKHHDGCLNSRVCSRFSKRGSKMTPLLCLQACMPIDPSCFSRRLSFLHWIALDATPVIKLRALMQANFFSFWWFLPKLRCWEALKGLLEGQHYQFFHRKLLQKILLWRHCFAWSVLFVSRFCKCSPKRRWHKIYKNM